MGPKPQYVDKGIPFLQWIQCTLSRKSREPNTPVRHIRTIHGMVAIPESVSMPESNQLDDPIVRRSAGPSRQSAHRRRPALELFQKKAEQCFATSLESSSSSFTRITRSMELESDRMQNRMYSSLPANWKPTYGIPVSTVGTSTDREALLLLKIMFAILRF